MTLTTSMPYMLEVGPKQILVSIFHIFSAPIDQLVIFLASVSTSWLRSSWEMIPVINSLPLRFCIFNRCSWFVLLVLWRLRQDSDSSNFWIEAAIFACSYLVMLYWIFISVFSVSLKPTSTRWFASAATQPLGGEKEACCDTCRLVKMRNWNEGKSNPK